MNFDKICEDNIYQYLLEQVPNFKEIYKDEIDDDDSIYYIFGRFADRFQRLQTSELQDKIDEPELNELNSYYQFINNISSLPLDTYTEELLAYGFFENLDVSSNNFRENLLNRLGDNAKELFLDAEKFWSNKQGRR